MSWYEVAYFFKRKYHQIERVLDFLPIIWKGFDFDYCYSLELFKKQLERQAKFLESDKACTLEARTNAQKIRTALRLMDKVYNGEYEMEWIDRVKQFYGSDILDWEFEDTGLGDGTSYLKYKYEEWNTTSAIKRELIKQSWEKQKRAEKLLWEFIGHNIRNWWD